MSKIKFETTESRFTGGMFAHFFLKLFSNLFSALTLGIAHPFMVCWRKKWELSHTYINGKQLAFDGNGFQFWGRYMLWYFLSIITLGIYFLFFMNVGVAKWEAKHTHFAEIIESGKVNESADNTSYFDGKGYQRLGVKLLTLLVTIETLFIGIFWAETYLTKWQFKHQVIDGQRLHYDANGRQLFLRTWLWIFLTFVTLGIYGFWYSIQKKKWEISHTHIETEPEKEIEQTQGSFSLVAFLLVTFGSVSGFGLPFGIILGIIALVKHHSKRPFAIASVAIGALWIEIFVLGGLLAFLMLNSVPTV